MSGLGSLLFSSASDSNDALKYSAPKEPKKKKDTKPSAPSSTEPQERSAPAPASHPPATSTQQQPASRIMSSGTVCLFKVNPSTGGYESVEGGAPMGCVLVGGGIVFQLLVYNSQKVPQCVVSLSPRFDYRLRDLYMSFADHHSGQWSIMFENKDVLRNFTLTLSLTLSHIASHQDDSSSMDCLVRSLPSESSAEDVTIDNGMTAGVYITIWELGEVEHYPIDVLNNCPPLKKIQKPDDVAKVKVVDGTDELVPGLVAAICGRKKGDIFTIGIPPSIAFKKQVSNSLIDHTSRKFPSSFLLAMVEIAKVKSGQDSKKKEKAAIDHVGIPESPPKAAAILTAPAVTSAPPSAGTDDLTSRMARLAKAAGGSSSVMSPHMVSQSTRGAEDVDAIHRSRTTSQGHSSDSHHPSQSQVPQQHSQPHTQPHIQQHIQPQMQQQQHAQQQHTQQHSQSHMHAQPQMHQQHSHHSNDWSSQGALAVIEGQTTRSYYSGDDRHQLNAGAQPSHQMHYQAPANNSSDGRHGSGNNYMVPGSSPYQPMDPALLLNLQQSVWQLHNKLDQLGMQNSNSSMLLQQLTQKLNFGGQSPMLYGQQSAPWNAQQPTGGTVGGAGKSKGAEALFAVQALAADYEALQARNAHALAFPEQSNANLTKLQERNEELQTRADKLMMEKSALLEKHANLLQSSSEQERLVMSLQRELDDLKRSMSSAAVDREDRERQLMQARADRDMIENLRFQIQTAQQDKSSLERQLFEEKQRCNEFRNQVSELKESISTAEEKCSRSLEQASASETRCAELLARVKEQEETISKISTAPLPPPPTPTPAASSGISPDEVKSMMQDLYVMCNEAFNDVGDLGGDGFEEHLQQVTKLHLKRLRDAIRSVTANKL